MRKLFKERKLFKGGNYIRKYSRSLDHLAINYTILCTLVKSTLAKLPIKGDK